MGLLPALDAETLTLAPLDPQARYVLVPEAGLRQAADDESALVGAEWQALQRTLEELAPLAATLRQVATMNTGASSALRNQLRALLHYHCGVSTLRTRQMMKDLQAL